MAYTLDEIAKMRNKKSGDSNKKTTSAKKDTTSKTKTTKNSSSNSNNTLKAIEALHKKYGTVPSAKTTVGKPTVGDVSKFNSMTNSMKDAIKSKPSSTPKGLTPAVSATIDKVKNTTKKNPRMERGLNSSSYYKNNTTKTPKASSELSQREASKKAFSEEMDKLEAQGFDGWEILKTSLATGLNHYNVDLFKTLDLLLPTEAFYPSWWENGFQGYYADSDPDLISQGLRYYEGLRDDYEGRRQKSLESAGEGVRFLSDMGVTATHSAAGMLPAIMTGGTSAAASGGASIAGSGASASAGIGAAIKQAGQQALKNPQTYTAILQTLGSDYDYAKSTGANDWEALAYAFATSVPNAMIETSGGTETLVGDIKGGANPIKSWAKSIPEEAMEEGYQRLVSGSTEKIIYNPDKEIFSTTNEDAIINPKSMLYEMGMGGGVAALLGAPSLGFQSAYNANQRRQIEKIGEPYSVNPKALIDEGLVSAPGSDSFKIASELKPKLDAGEVISPFDLGRLAIANNKEIRNEMIDEEEGLPSSIEEAAIGRVISEETDGIPEVSEEVDNVPTEVKTPAETENNEVLDDVEETTPINNEATVEAAPTLEQRIAETEAKAVETAFELGKKNTPRESIKLETPAQEEAYNAGRIEHIKNMPKEAEVTNIDSESKQAYNVSEKTTDNTVDEAPKTRLTDKEKRVFTKGRDIGVSFSEERGYISDGFAALPINKADADFAKSEWGARDSDKLSSVVERIINRDDYIPLTSNPVEGLLTTGLSRSGSSSVYMFTLDDGRQFAVQKKYAKFLDGNNLSVVFEKGKPYALKATDAEGNFAGMALAIRPNGDTYDISDTKEVSMKSFKNKSVVKADYTKTTEGGASNDIEGSWRDNEGTRQKESGREETGNKPTSDVYGDFGQDVRGEQQKLTPKELRAHAVQPPSGSIAANEARILAEEYDIESFVIPDSVWDRKKIAFSNNRKVYMKTGVEEEGRNTVSYHEATHVMKQSKFMPYLTLLDGFSDVINVNNKTTRNALQYIYESRELKGDITDEKVLLTVYDEMCATVYGYYKSGVKKDNIEARLRETFKDYDMFITQMDKIHEDFKAKVNAQDKIVNTEKESAEDVHDGVLDGKSDNDTGVRESESVQEAEKERNTGTEGRKSRKDVVDENGTDVQAVEGEKTADRPVDSGSDDNGVRERDNSDGDSRTGTRGNDNVDVKSKDYVITKAVAEEIDTTAPSMDDNIKAIETLHELEKTGKAPTKAQQSILAKFKGWGGLAGSFYGRERSRLRELMSDSEISAAQSTVNDAYFTPTNIIDNVYKALGHLGFEGGNVLEPSMGVGNFFGRMPKAVKDNSSLYGVEIDTISGRIAQHLYPSANISISPFQDVAYKDGAFDLIIGNVPFGEVKYKYKGNKYLIHDYFFVKAMDKLKDGGVMAFLTSRGTLDKMDSKTRAELNKQGKLIAAYRLPSSVFTRSAGASPVTDLIIMQKASNTNGEKFVNLGNVSVAGEDFSINEYFVNNPQNIIGELTKKWNYRSKKYDIDVRATGDVSEQLTKAIKKLPKNLINGTQTVGSVDVTENTAPMQTFSVKDNSTVEYIDAQTGEVKQIKGKNANVAKAYIKIKDIYQGLVDATLNEKGQAAIESKRKELNTEYDSFVKKYGTLEKNKKLLTADNDFYKISGLEVYDTKTKSIVKSEMFKKDTLGKRKPKRADSTLDALSISIGESGGVDLARISELTNLPESEVVNQLDDRIVYTPDGIYELNEVYLSGNVREKYEAVKGKKGFEKNEKMLKNVIPEDIPAKNITPQFGAPWIQPKHVAQFLKETLNLYSTPTVSYDSTTGTWAISGDTWGDHTLMTSKFGTKYQDAIKLAEKALNMRRIVVKDNEGRVIVAETRAAQQKAEDIKAAFEEWCFKDSERRQELVKTFNEKFNSHRNMDFSELSKYLTFDGLTETFKLRDYQKRAVARAIFNGNTLLAHGVGTGKTAEMIAVAMELRRMGIAKKNMMVVPPHKVADFRNDILKMYPSAKVIMLEKGANAAQRQRFYAQVAANDFDIVIIPHSSFGMLDVSAETKAAFVSNQIAELEDVLTAAQAENGKIDGRFIRQLEKQKKSLEEKLKFVTESTKDNGNTFEELGVDSLFVDEAHNFKNLPFSSKLSRVAGVSVNQSNNKTRASRAENMFMITDYLNRNSGRITFGTATPITNSMSEIYNMTRFLRPDILEEAGIQSFDAWASMFGSIVNQAEVDPSGRHMRMKERFSKFKNVAQMVEQFRRMADILKTGDVLQDLPVAERVDVVNESNDIQEEFLDIIDKMIDEIRTSGQNAKHNMLEVTTAGQMAAVDLRFVESYFDGKYTRDELNLPNSRVAQVASKVVKEYNESNANKGTQFVFCDVGVNEDPSRKYNLHVYGDLINRLVAAGIPRNEIAVAQDFDDKADLSAKVNTGEIRVLIGSTAVMGEGMNAQNKAVALHHMTVPARPSDIEQREGRIIRYGNENKNVRIYRYIQEKSYDSYQWQMQERKASFINQALSGGTVEELEEMSDFQLTAREAKAIASGNPLLLEKIEVEDKLNKLKSLRNKYNTDKLEMQDRLAMLPNRIGKLEKTIADTKADIATINASGKEFEITVGKTKYSERAKAAEALEKAVSKAPRNGTSVLIGKYKGLDLYYSSSIGTGIQYVLKGNKDYTIEGGESARGNITRIINTVEKISSDLDLSEAMLKNYKAEIETLKKEIVAEFPKAKELDELQAKLNEIDTQLGINVSEVDMSEVVVGEEDADVDQMRGAKEADHSEQWTAERVGDKNKKPKSLAEIIEGIRHDFDVNITVGHIRGNDIRGTHTKGTGGIRTKKALDLPTIAHELGHEIDERYGFSDAISKDMKDELVGQLDDGLREKYSADKLVGEGISEYVRKFLQNRETAAIDYPLFTDHFLGSLSAKDLALVETLADDVNAYYSLDADTATSSIKGYGDKAPDARTFTGKMKAKGSMIYQAWMDANHSIKRFDIATGSNVYKLALNASYADAIAGNMISGGSLTDKNGRYVAPGLMTALNGIDLNDKDSYLLFGEYLTVKHGPERLNEGMRTFSDDRKNSTAWMNKRQSEIEAEHPEFVEISERLYDFWDKFMKTWAVKTGIVSESTYKSWRERWEYYVPFNRVVMQDGVTQGVKKGFANQNNPIKKAKGSGRDIIHPVDNMIVNMVKMIKVAVQNSVAVELTKAAKKLHADAAFLEKVPMPMAAKTFDMTDIKESLTEMLETGGMNEKDTEIATGFVNGLDDILVQYSRGKAHGDVIFVLKDGKPEAWKINDAGLLDSLTHMSAKQTSSVLDAYAVTSRFMTANITGMNLVWSIFSNLPRDMMTYATYSKNKNPVKMATGIGSAYLNKLKGENADPYYKEFLALGGGQTSVYTSDRRLTRTARKKMKRKAGSGLEKVNWNPLATISFIGDTVESGPRYATYRMCREMGMSEQEAFYEAMDITVNFRRGGKISREFNKFIPFFNANMQGLDKFRRWITAEEYAGKENRKKAIVTRTTTYFAVSAALAALTYAINNGDDEEEKEYEQLSNYIKNSYWNIPIGDGKYFSIPKPRELGVLSSFFETCMEYGIGDNDHAFDEFYAYASENFLPAIANDIAQMGSKGFVESWLNVLGSAGVIGVVGYLGANRDFLGRPIVSSGLQNLEPKDQYTDRTSKIAYWLGQAFNASPQQIDYFFQQTLGGWWKTQKALFPVGGDSVDYTLGIRNTYVKDNQYSTDLTNWLYDRADTTAKAKNSNPTDIDKAISAKWDSNMTSFYGKYYKQAKNKSDTTATRGTRQLVLDMIREYQKGIDNNYKTGTQKAVEKVCKEQNSTEYLPSVMSVEVMDGNDKKHKLSDIQYVEYQTDYLRLYYETIEDTLPDAKTKEERAKIILAAKRVAAEQAKANTLSRIGAPKTSFSTKYKGVTNEHLTEYFAAKSMADGDGTLKKSEVVDILRGMDVSDDEVWTLYMSQYDSEGAKIAKKAGISGSEYIDVLDALDQIDQPNKSGKMGTYTSAEITAAISVIKGLTTKERAILWQTMTGSTSTKNNPWW